MKNIATIKFHDTQQSDEALVIVRSDGQTVGLTLSLGSNGDIEVFMSREITKQVIEALNKSID